MSTKYTSNQEHHNTTKGCSPFSEVAASNHPTSILTFPEIRRISGNVSQVRLVIWRGALSMFLAKPIFGWGLGTFQINFPQFRASDYSRKGVSHNTLHAHSEYLEAAAELGVIGLGAFLTIIAFYFMRIYKALKRFEEEKPKLLIIGFGCGVLANLVHNLVSVNLRWTEPAVTFWFAFGLTMVLADWQSLKKTLTTQSSEKRGEKQLAYLAIEDFFGGFTKKFTKATRKMRFEYINVLVN